jgi:hypothetical protein
MTAPASSSPPAADRPGWRQQAARVGIGLAAAALLFFIGWMMGRGPIAEMERERDAAMTRSAVLAAGTAAYRSAVALEARNFGTANDHLRTAAAALGTIPAEGDVPGLGDDAAAGLAEVRSRLGATDLNVAVDVESQREEVLRLAARLGEIAAASAPASDSR